MNDDCKSKTQIKNESKALQKLGEQLVALSSVQLDKIDLPETLSMAVSDACQMTRHEAKRRQMQYIGKLMRKIDPVPIQNALQNIRQGDFQKAFAFKKIEKWRDALKSGNMESIEDIIDSCPNAQRQRMNQLARNARESEENRKSKENTKATRASKALLSYLKKIYKP